MKTFDNSGFAALLALTTVMSAAGIDGVLPLMPALGEAFGGDREAVQLTLTMFMLGIAVGQLIHGPISDRFGRKPAIVGGLVVTSIATAGCALSTSIETLTVFRFVHGLAASSGWLIARAVVRDKHEHDDAARVLRLLYVADLQRLQEGATRVVERLQESSANPRTEQRLGRVGR